MVVGWAYGVGPGGEPEVVAWWSPDGRTWEAAPVELGPGGQVFSVATTLAGFLATGPSGDPSCLGGIWDSADGRAWSCVASDPALTGFGPYAAAGSPTTEVAVGLTSAGGDSPNGLPGAVWWRPAPWNASVDPTRQLRIARSDWSISAARAHEATIMLRFSSSASPAAWRRGPLADRQRHDAVHPPLGIVALEPALLDGQVDEPSLVFGKRAGAVLVHDVDRAQLGEEGPHLGRDRRIGCRRHGCDSGLTDLEIESGDPGGPGPRAHGAEVTTPGCTLDASGRGDHAGDDGVRGWPRLTPVRGMPETASSSVACVRTSGGSSVPSACGRSPMRPMRSAPPWPTRRPSRTRRGRSGPATPTGSRSSPRWTAGWWAWRPAARRRSTRRRPRCTRCGSNPSIAGRASRRRSSAAIVDWATGAGLPGPGPRRHDDERPGDRLLRAARVRRQRHAVPAARGSRPGDPDHDPATRRGALIRREPAPRTRA